MGDAFSVPFMLSCLFILPIKHLIYLPINLHNHCIQFPLISRGFSCGKQLNKSPNTRNRVHLKDDSAKLRAEVIIVTFFDAITTVDSLKEIFIFYAIFTFCMTTVVGGKHGELRISPPFARILRKVLTAETYSHIA